MDKVIRYKHLVKKLLVEMARRFRDNSDWEIIEIYDEARGQYLLFMDSWKEEIRDYGCIMHLEIKPDGKVWIRRDGTDLDIGRELLEKGVKKSELVLGFDSPWMRSLSDFAVA